MLRMCKLALVLTVAGALAAPAMAQGKKGGFGRGGGLGMYIGNEAVQKELKLEPEQVEKATAAVREISDKHRDDFAKLRDIDDMQERMTKMRELTTAISEETTKALGEILKPEQIKRLEQIELYNAGAMAFSRPKVAEKLKLTDEQKEKIQQINMDSFAQIRELFTPGEPPTPETQEKMRTIRKETMDKIVAVFNDDQKAAWKELTGKPFEVQMQFGRRGKKKDN